MLVNQNLHLEPNLEIGKGSFAIVYLKTQGDITIAVKKIQLTQRFTLQLAANQAQLLRICSHPNIVKYHCSYHQSPEIFCIEMEHVPNGNLQSYQIKNNYQLLFKWTFQICQGLCFLHKRGIIHRDVKPSNLMVDSKGSIKLIDFGVSTFNSIKDSNRNLIVGSPTYMAPQVFLKKGYNQKIDIYSLGICLYELAFGRLPFTGTTKQQYWQNSIKKQIMFIETCPAILVELIKMMTYKSPSRRASAQGILNFLNSVQEQNYQKSQIK